MVTETDILYSRMAGCLSSLDFSAMNNDERLQLANACEETRAGLCHCLNYIGDSLVKYPDNDGQRSVPVHRYSLGHSLTTIGLLLPMLTDLEQLIRADVRKMEEQRR